MEGREMENERQKERLRGKREGERDVCARER